MTTAADTHTRAQVADAIRQRHRFVIASHLRPDGDAVGSQLALAYALRTLGKDVRVVSRDPAPEPFRAFPGVAAIEIVDRVDDVADAVIVMESGDLPRTGIAGLDRGFVVNIDHHVGNALFGAVNWLDLSAAACGEMVFDLVAELGVPLSYEVALHVYIAVLTDTGSFRHSNITSRTFDICRRCADAGVNASAIASQVYDNSHLSRLKIMGAVLSRMQLDESGRLAMVTVDQALITACGGSYEDTDGLINMPLTVREIQAVIFFKEVGPSEWRISMRSKGQVNVNAVAKVFGGGGHRNASGCSASGSLEEIRRDFLERLLEQIDLGSGQ
jgi:phosphoesterase RecJ-like protein